MSTTCMLNPERCLTLRASAAAGVWAARDDPLPPGLKGTIAGRRDADDALLIPLPSLSSGADPLAPGVRGDGAGEGFAPGVADSQ